MQKLSQPIAVLSDEELEASRIAKQQDIQTLLRQLEQARAKADVGLAWRRKNLKAEKYREGRKSE